MMCLFKSRRICKVNLKVERRIKRREGNVEKEISELKVSRDEDRDEN